MSELWDLVWGKPAIDAGQLAAAIEREAARGDLDFRTRLLIRDGAQALEDYWGRERQEVWLRESSAGPRVNALRSEDLGPVKFPSIKERLVERTEPEAVRQYLRHLGSLLQRPARVTIGGAAALLLQADIVRATEDIDVVDEVPAEIRAMHSELAELRALYGLHLAHFQSHYLPKDWESRTHTLGSFGGLHVSLVDINDLFLGKLFSPRAKDLADLRVLSPRLDREALERRLRECCAGFLADPALRAHAERNWYVLTGDSLPAPPGGSAA
jgi:hypothetical protein